MKGRTANKKTAPGKIEKLNSTKKSVSDKRKKNGGARPGAGRKPSEERLALLGYKQVIDKHGHEMVQVTEVSGGKTKIVEKSRLLAMLDILFIEGHQKRNITAVKEYLDRVLGKAPQALEHSGEIDSHIIDQHVPTKAERAAVAAYYAVKDEEDE